LNLKSAIRRLENGGKKNKYAGLIVCLIGICIFGLAISGNVLAKSKKVRLNVGFGAEEVL